MTAHAPMPEPQDIAALRETAEAATPGPWAWQAVSENDNGWCLGVVWGENDEPLSGRVEADEGEVIDQVCELMFASTFRDAEFIAATSPDVVLALLSEVERGRALRAAVEGVIARLDAAYAARQHAGVAQGRAIEEIRALLAAHVPPPPLDGGAGEGDR